MKNRLPLKAMVLAAGYGTRLLPLTRHTPKPLMPLWGRPILDHLLRMLRSWGVEDVLINLHHAPEALFDWVQHRPFDGLRFSFSFEPDILGTGGALAKASWFFDENPFWLMNADVAADLDPQPFIKVMQTAKPLAAVWLDERRGPRTVEMAEGKIRCFQSASPGSPGTYTFCGLHLLSPRILKYLPTEGFSTIIQGYEAAVKNGENVVGICPTSSFWADIGTPEQYLEAHRQVLEAARAHQPGKRLLDPRAYRRMAQARRAGVQIDGFAAIGQDTDLVQGARIENSVIWDGARLNASAHIQEAIIGRNTPISGHAARLVLRAEDALEAQEQNFLATHGWKPETLTAQYFGARGSARSFIRLRGRSAKAILVRYSREREENQLYAPHSLFLARIGIRVPALLADDPQNGLSLYEDLGDQSLQKEILHASTRRIQQDYERVLDAVWRWHSQGTQEARRQKIVLMPPFSPSLYEWERQYFIENMLQKRLSLKSLFIRQIRLELEEASRRLWKAPRVLIHRDLQSSNVLWVKGRPAFIDYQGMRWGAAVYDLASLLCDPYVSLPEDLQQHLLDYYARRHRDPDSIHELFWWAAVQRLAQALGAYARLSAQPGMANFASHIAPASRMLARSFKHLPELPGLRAFTELPAVQQTVY
jgi:mannose-1-phosphate guanylyltransferase